MVFLLYFCWTQLPCTPKADIIWIALISIWQQPLFQQTGRRGWLTPLPWQQSLHTSSLGTSTWKDCPPSCKSSQEAGTKNWHKMLAEERCNSHQWNFSAGYWPTSHLEGRLHEGSHLKKTLLHSKFSVLILEKQQCSPRHYPAIAVSSISADDITAEILYWSCMYHTIIYHTM